MFKFYVLTHNFVSGEQIGFFVLYRSVYKMSRAYLNSEKVARMTIRDICYVYSVRAEILSAITDTNVMLH